MEDKPYIDPLQIIIIFLVSAVLAGGLTKWIMENCTYGGGIGGCF